MTESKGVRADADANAVYAPNSARPLQQRRRLHQPKPQTLWGYFFISPWIIGFLLFSLGPILANVYFSFTNYTVIQAPEWVGTANYQEMFTTDELFTKSLSNTGLYVLLRIPSFIIVGLGLAIMLNRKIPGIRFLRTAFYLPTILPIVASSVIWLWLANPQLGFLNTFFRDQFGILLPNWLQDRHWALITILVMGVWQIGQTMMIFLAGLQEIPDSLYEAAAIDGVSRFQKYRYITLPMMTPTIYFNVLTGIIGAFQVFGAAFILTNGGPANSTLFYVLYLYRRAFQFLDVGYAAALSIILFLFVLAITILIVKTSNRWVNYDRI